MIQQICIIGAGASCPNLAVFEAGFGLRCVSFESMLTNKIGWTAGPEFILKSDL